MGKENNKILNFPFQVQPEGTPLTDFQLICEVRIKLTDKLNKAARGEYQLTEEDRQDIVEANDVFKRNGYAVIDFDLL